MNKFNRLLAATFLTATMMFSGTVQAMEIQQYDRMNSNDQDRYVAELIIGAEKVLRDAGQTDKADQVDKFFSEVKPGDSNSLGMVEFEINLAKARLADVQRSEKDPNARRLEVEDAMYVTLKKKGIELPTSFFTVLANFHPKYPPQNIVARNGDAPQPPQQ